MVEVIVVVRESGTVETDFSLNFELPEIPRIGEYISIRRLDQREPFGEDVRIRHVWWRLHHPETNGFASSDKPAIGKLVEIFVECDPALSPYSCDSWRRSLESARSGTVEEFNVARRFAKCRPLQRGRPRQDALDPIEPTGSEEAAIGFPESAVGICGKRLGNPKLSKAAERGIAAGKAAAGQFAANVLPVIREIQASGVTSHNAIAAKLNERKVKTARGGRWSHVQVGMILARMPT